MRFEDVSPAEGLNKLVAKKIAAYVVDASILEFQALANCKIQLLEGKINTVNAAFAVRRQSPYKDKLNDGIIEAWADNYIEELKRKYFEWANECHDYGQVADDESLNLEHVGGSSQGQQPSVSLQTRYFAVYKSFIALILIVRVKSWRVSVRSPRGQKG